jgi:hypothetical protein
MNQLFPYANILTGVLVLIVGFLLHWIGQLVSVLNWDFAMKIGLQEKEAPPEYKVYEHGIAMADAALGWIYGIAGIGLILGTSWGFKLTWFPGVVFIYHGLSYWFWTANHKRAGYQIQPYRIVWFLVNLITGVLAVLVAWNGS